MNLWLGFLVVFIGALSLQAGLWYYLRYRAERLRLMRENVEPLFTSTERKSWLGRVGESFDRTEMGRRMEQQIQEMDLPLKPSELILARVIAYSGAFVLIIYMLNLGVLLSAVCSVAAVESGLWLFHRWRKQRYLRTIEEQLPYACRLLGNAVRAGQSIPQGLQTVARAMQPPLGPHFRRVVNELSLGMTMERTFERLEERLPSRELRFFLNTVLIQKETGGNLTQVMEDMADALKERQTVNQAIQTATSEGRFTTLLLPVFGFAFLVILAQAYGLERILSHPIGIIVVAIFLCGQVVGFILVQRISRIEV